MKSTTPDENERTLLENLFEGVYYVDRERRITYWNQAAERITGFTGAEVIGRRCLDDVLMHVDGAGSSLCQGACPLLRTMLDGRPRETQLFLHHRQGHRLPVAVRTAPICDASGAVVGAVEVFREGDIEASDPRELEELRRWAQVDELTDIANRRALGLQLQAKLEDQSRFGWPFGVVLIDIDHFKAVNDVHGHPTGDRALEVVARTLVAGVRQADVVGRWGGEEFMILAPMIRPAELAALSERMRRMIAASRIDLNGVLLEVTASLGATLARPDDNVESLLLRVDELLYRSKQEGRNRVSLDAEAADATSEPPPPASSTSS